VKNIEQLQPFLKGGPAHDPKQLAEVVKIHLTCASDVHQLWKRECAMNHTLFLLSKFLVKPTKSGAVH
jgi:hypothetical protein